MRNNSLAEDILNFIGTLNNDLIKKTASGLVSTRK